MTNLEKERVERAHILRSLDHAQHKDLSKHLYSAHLLHRRPATIKRGLFPSKWWAEWPIPSSQWSHSVKNRKAREAANYDHKVPVPGWMKEFTDVDNPRQELMGLAAVETFPIEPVERPIEYFAGKQEDLPVVDQGPDAEKKLARARKLLLFEMNANFQRQIHQRISKDQLTNKEKKRLVPIIDPSPSLGIQSRVRLMDMVNRVLERIAEEREKYINRFHDSRSSDWANIIMDDVLVGDTFGRCSRLFGIDPRDPGFTDWAPNFKEEDLYRARITEWSYFKKRKTEHNDNDEDEGQQAAETSNGSISEVMPSEGASKSKLDPLTRRQYQSMNLMNNTEDMSLINGGRSCGEAHRALGRQDVKLNTNELIDMMTVKLDEYPVEIEHLKSSINKAAREAKEFQKRADAISKEDTLRYLDCEIFERGKKLGAIVKMPIATSDVRTDPNFIWMDLNKKNKSQKDELDKEVADVEEESDDSEDASDDGDEGNDDEDQ